MLTLYRRPRARAFTKVRAEPDGGEAARRSPGEEDPDEIGDPPPESAPESEPEAPSHVQGVRPGAFCSEH